MESPRLVPRVSWVTLPGLDAVQGARERGRRGLQRRCIVHLDIVEDLTVEATPMPSKGSWSFGIVDGERAMRDRGERITDNSGDRDHRRREDDDDDRDRRGRAGWREAIRRSLSRFGRAGGWDPSRPRQEAGRERDRSGNRDGGGRRRGAGVEEPEVQAPLSVQAAPMLLLLPEVQSRADAGAEEDWVDAADDWSDEDAGVLADDHPTPHRGRERTRSATPAVARRLSRAAATPPTSPDPPSSPTAVCPSSPTSKGCGQQRFRLFESSSEGSLLVLSPSVTGSVSSEARRLLDVFAPDSMMVMPSRSPSRPPGFDGCASTPPFIPSGTQRRTPSPARRQCLATASPNAQEVAATSLLPLFAPCQQPLLSPPFSSPPVRPTNRRKTLAGATIGRTVGFTLRKKSERFKSRRKAAPVARAAETAVCRGLGIIQDGEVVTELAMAEFARRFEGQVQGQVLQAMRVLFKVDTPEQEAVDDALINHGGAAALDHSLEDGDATADV